MGHTPLQNTPVAMHAKLRVKLDGKVLRLYVIRPGQLFDIGRQRGTSIVVDDPRVSRRHALLGFTGERLMLTDLGSRNGTYVTNAQLVPNQPTELEDGSHFKVGRHILHVELFNVGSETQKETNAHRKLDGPLLPPNEFELLEEIGSGGVGRVWTAMQKVLGRKVAIKFLRDEVSPDSDFQRRFLREARVSCRLRSPYVVKTYDVRISQGRAYMIMELVHGPCALDVVLEDPLPIREVISIGADVARALDAAAALGIVHRDVKPANILLHPSGTAKLGDFGIAKDMMASVNLTETGMGLGSLPYASPEQVMDAKSVDHRTDLYGLGATLYHLLTGIPPFLQRPKEGLAGMVKRICTRPPKSVRTLRSDCPPKLAVLVHRMLNKERPERPASAVEVADQLQSLLERLYGSTRKEFEVTDTDD